MNVVLLGRMPAAGEQRLKAMLEPEHAVYTIREPGEAGSHLDAIAKADVIVGGPITPEISERADRLRLFQVFRGGIDGLGIEQLPDRVAITNTYHHEIGVAEFAVLACLMLPRRIIDYDTRLRNGDWSGSVMWGAPPEYLSLGESAIVLVGAGHIGSAIITRLEPFGSRIVVVSRNPAKREAVGIDGGSVDGTNRQVAFVSYDQFHDVLSRADIVVLSVRLAPNTTNLISAPELEIMKPSSYLINVSRGGVVDQHALYEALRSKSIAGAASDVWYNYPKTIDERCLPSDAPLFELDSMLLSPNRSSWTNQMLEGRVRDVAENVVRLAEHRELINIVRTGESESSKPENG